MTKTPIKRKGYKYRLHELLRKLPVSDYEVAMNYLPLKLNIDKRTFQDWIYIKVDSPRQITSEQLLAVASFFQVEPVDMLTYPPESLSIEAMKQDHRDDLVNGLN